MTDYRVLRSEFNALNLYGLALIFTAYTPIFSPHFQDFRHNTLPEKNLATFYLIIVLLTIYLVMRQKIPRQILFAKPTTLLSYAILSICWLILGSILWSLDIHFSPSTSDDSALGTGKSAKDDSDEPSRRLVSSIPLSLYVVWLLNMIVIGVTLGVLHGSNGAILVEKSRALQAAKAGESISTLYPSDPFAPLPETSQKVGHHETKESNRGSHGQDSKNPESEKTLTKEQEKETKEDDQKNLALSRKRYALSVLSLAFSLLHLWYLDAMRDWISTWTILSWTELIKPLGLKDLILDYSVYSLIPVTVMILIGRQIYRTM